MPTLDRPGTLNVMYVVFSIHGECIDAGIALAKRAWAPAPQRRGACRPSLALECGGCLRCNGSARGGAQRRGADRGEPRAWCVGYTDTARKQLRAIAAQRAPRAGPSTVRDATPSASRATPAAPLQRDKGLGDYIEFDLTRLQNSKGGFLVEDTGEDALQALEEQRKEREREKQRLRDQMEPGISLDPTTRPVCKVCQSPDILYDPFLRVFNVRVCRACERAHPEQYSLLTKTEVKEVRCHSNRRTTCSQTVRADD